MTRVLAIGRLALYAAAAAGAATSPDLARTLSLLGSYANPAAFAQPAAASLGWLATPLAGALVRTFGFGGLAGATALCILGTLALVEWRARRSSSPFVALAAAVLSLCCMLDALHVGDGAADGLFLAALLAALDLSRTRAVVLVAAITVVWCNCSPAGVLAPTFAVAFALGTMLDRAGKADRMHAQLCAVASAVASLATPAFLAFPQVAWRALSLGSAYDDLMPGAPAVVAPLAYHAGVILTIVVALAVGARAARTGDTLVFALAAVYAFAKGAYVPFVGIAAAPILAEAATRMLAARRARGQWVAPADGRTFARSSLATLLAVAIVAGIAGAYGFAGFDRARHTAPFDALARYARAGGTHGRLLCTRLAWCDMAESSYHLNVLADSRLPNAPVATVGAQRTISSAAAGWRHEAKSFGVDAIFADRRSGFATLLLADGWRPFAVDGNGALFVRSGAAL